MGGAKRVDYSHKIGRGKPSYVFELRRPNDEVYSATIPAPFNRSSSRPRAIP
ncbi:MAG: hypothetical protein U0235_10140 [Polyangiaceae bacterium]